MAHITPVPCEARTGSNLFEILPTFRNLSQGVVNPGGGTAAHSVEAEPFSLRAPPVLLRNLMHKQRLTTASPRNLDQSQFANL